MLHEEILQIQFLPLFFSSGHCRAVGGQNALRFGGHVSWLHRETSPALDQERRVASLSLHLSSITHRPPACLVGFLEESRELNEKEAYKLDFYILWDTKAT